MRCRIINPDQKKKQSLSHCETMLSGKKSCTCQFLVNSLLSDCAFYDYGELNILIKRRYHPSSALNGNDMPSR